LFYDKTNATKSLVVFTSYAHAARRSVKSRSLLKSKFPEATIQIFSDNTMYLLLFRLSEKSLIFYKYNGWSASETKLFGSHPVTCR
jgi:hypothetical protein